ncbi:MAG: hypothetical protein R6U68_17560 [Desulfobacteraceae bacterium]
MLPENIESDPVPREVAENINRSATFEKLALAMGVSVGQVQD